MTEFITSVSVTGLDLAFHLVARITNKSPLFLDKLICFLLYYANETSRRGPGGKKKTPKRISIPEGIYTFIHPIPESGFETSESFILRLI